MSLLFDKRDRDLLEIVNGLLSTPTLDAIGRKNLFPWFHPHGIKELAESHGLRIAYAVAHLLTSLKTGMIEDRLNALRSLRDEILSAPAGSMPKNAARLLLSIMKELVRAHGNEPVQLRLAHDFRRVAGGKPSIVRKILERYDLLEMPEAWNQLTFDDHVHDIHTKGRKSASHLIMDAWIKGIRRLRVIYYHFIDPSSAAELIEASRIMGVQLRIGIEFPARFREKIIQLIWVPRGFYDPQSFLCFLAEEPVRQLMDQGRELSRYRQQQVVDLLEVFNHTHRLSLNAELGIDLPTLGRNDFLAFAHPGQPSKAHLANYIHSVLKPLMEQKVADLREEFKTADQERQSAIQKQFTRMNALDAKAIVDLYLKTSDRGDSAPTETPKLLGLSLRQLLDRLTSLHTGYRITLNLTDLLPEDVVEILYEGEGLITRLEIFNLKDLANGKTGHVEEISKLQLALNESNTINLKRILRDIIARINTADPFPGKADRIEKLGIILHDIEAFSAMYQSFYLQPRIGSDYTGLSPSTFDMGLAILDTLPEEARQAYKKRPPIQAKDAPHPDRTGSGQTSGKLRGVVPFRIPIYKRVTYIPSESPKGSDGLFRRLIRHLPGFNLIGHTRQADWLLQSHLTRMADTPNVVSLSGMALNGGNGFCLENKKASQPPRASFFYLNSTLRNILKIAVGFVPAFLSFYLTNQWWVLAYLGAFIWFGITGVRNIVQSVLGGGGFRRSPLLGWNEYVSWERISDSLLFTGFSVPLLDVLVKTMLLDSLLGINTVTNPIALYTVMAVANGIYLSSHNLFRGLPRAAVYGNFFRSVLSIPIAIAMNTLIGMLLGGLGVVGIQEILQKWAAVISKGASDIVAGVIEGTADRFTNIQTRFKDYADTLSQLFSIYGRLEALQPELKVWETLDAIESNRIEPGSDAKDLEKLIVVGCLDLLYFWMYQPRGRTALKYIVETLSDEEKRIFIGCLAILKREREISQMFIDGVVGMNFSKGLSFYLQCAPGYLRAMDRLFAH